MLEIEYLTGQKNEHLTLLESGGKQHWVLPELIPAWHAFQRVAKVQGFDPIIVSGFRSFERQLHIWNDKVNGLRTVLDVRDQVVDLKALDDIAKVHAIMTFSALPGTSRHHWGTDIDIADASVLSDGYQLQLTESETCGNGLFAPFYRWLATFESDDWDFWRPYYRQSLSEVACEPWHLSLKKPAQAYAQSMNPDRLKAFIAEQDILLKPTIIKHFDEIYKRYMLSF